MWILVSNFICNHHFVDSQKRVQMAGQPSQPVGPPTPDPMNALRAMAHQGGNNQMMNLIPQQGNQQMHATSCKYLDAGKDTYFPLRTFFSRLYSETFVLVLQTLNQTRPSLQNNRVGMQVYRFLLSKILLFFVVLMFNKIIAWCDGSNGWADGPCATRSNAWWSNA